MLHNEPWSYDKHLIMFQRYNRDTVLKDYKLNETALWVQVHNIPLGYMDREIAEEICITVGKVVKTEGLRELWGDSFIRVRVTVDITQPFCRRRVVTLEIGTKSWVSFRYERLPNLCYWCTCLDHDDKDCKVWLKNDGNSNLRKKKYDLSICVKLVYSSNKNVIYVPGYVESRKSRLIKPSSLSKGQSQAMVKETIPKAPSPSTTETASENLEPSINADDSIHSRSTASNSVIESDPLQPNNGKEDFLERIEELDKDMERFELTENDDLGPNLTIRTMGGPSLDSNVSVAKPTRWARIVRPSTSYEDSYSLEHLGKRSNLFYIDEHLVQKRMTQDATLDKQICFYSGGG